MRLSEDEVAEVLAKYDKAQNEVRMILEKYLRTVDHPAIDAVQQIEDFGREMTHLREAL